MRDPWGHKNDIDRKSNNVELFLTVMHIRGCVQVGDLISDLQAGLEVLRRLQGQQEEVRHFNKAVVTATVDLPRK